MPAKRPAPRLALIDEPRMTDAQRALLANLRAGPRGSSITPRGPFAAWMHAPAFGELAQKLGAHCRYQTALPPRLSEFAILCTEGCGARNMNGLRTPRWPRKAG